jgi:hypothetical protein
MEDRKSFLLRINPALWKEIEAWAQEDMRSVNAQIEFLLKQAVIKHRGSSGDGEAPVRNAKKK